MNKLLISLKLFYPKYFATYYKFHPTLYLIKTLKFVGKHTNLNMGVMLMYCHELINK